MPSTLPDGDPVPADGSLPASALHGLGERPFGFYVHVPFCVTRCGYCDFNTYTPGELGGANPDGWLDALRIELDLAAAALPAPMVNTVFVGGGTPSLLGGDGLAAVLERGLAGTRALPGKHGLAVVSYAHVVVEIPDAPGALARPRPFLNKPPVLGVWLSAARRFTP